MYATDDKIYRTRDGLIAGVCGGIARHLDVDPSIVRLFAVVLAILTAGVLVPVYLAMWLIIPLEPEDTAAVEVAPDSIASEVYDQVIRGRKHGKNASVAPSVGGGHVPPVPPAAGKTRDAATAYYHAAMPVTTAAGSTSPKQPMTVALGVTLGVVLVVSGMAMLLSNWVHVFSALQFWPLIVVAFGIVRMVIPGKVGRRMTVFGMGFALFLLGLTLLLSTLGIVLIRTSDWLLQGWPLLSLALGFLVLGNAVKSPVLVFCAIAVMAAFFAVGCLFYMDPGPAQSVYIPLPLDAGLSLELGQ